MVKCYVHCDQDLLEEQSDLSDSMSDSMDRKRRKKPKKNHRSLIFVCDDIQNQDFVSFEFTA